MTKITTTLSLVDIVTSSAIIYMYIKRRARQRARERERARETRGRNRGRMDLESSGMTQKESTRTDKGRYGGGETAGQTRRRHTEIWANE